MNKVDTTKCCAKCGAPVGGKAAIQYVHPSSCSVGGFFVRTCGRCGHMWREYPLDATQATIDNLERLEKEERLR